MKQLAGGEISSNEIAGEDPWTVAKSLGLGWNLGNQLDAHNSGVANETAWGIKRRHRLYLINWLLRVLLPYVFLLHGWDILETPPVMK